MNNSMKIALITGITGQDGSYLAELLISKGYNVHGIIRRSSTFNTWRINHLYKNLEITNRFKLHYGDLTDSINIIRLIKEVCPDEIYNLGAQSHVKVSFETAEYTANCDGLGILRILEAVRLLDLGNKCRIYQASTSELFGNTEEIQNEKTVFNPRSPYGSAKLYGFYVVKNYREAYNLFASNGILFNHESPRRGQTFVTRKISVALCKIKLQKQDILYLGNLEAKRDWGYAPEYVEAIWKILQHDQPDDFVISTGQTHSVREFVEVGCKILNINLVWEGEGINERGIDTNTGNTIIQIDPKYFRPTEINVLIGDGSKAKKLLNWEPQTNFNELVKIMIHADMERIKNKEILY